MAAAKNDLVDKIARDHSIALIVITFPPYIRPKKGRKREKCPSINNLSTTPKGQTELITN